MTTTETQRATELAARFSDLKAAEEQARRDGSTERRAIVNELIDQLHVHPLDVAKLLDISLTRVYQLRGVRK